MTTARRRLELHCFWTWPLGHTWRSTHHHRYAGPRYTDTCLNCTKTYGTAKTGS